MSPVKSSLSLEDGVMLIDDGEPVERPSEPDAIAVLKHGSCTELCAGLREQGRAESEAGCREFSEEKKRYRSLVGLVGDVLSAMVLV
jgi:hypothetical protein